MVRSASCDCLRPIRYGSKACNQLSPPILTDGLRPACRGLFLIYLKQASKVRAILFNTSI